MHVKSVMVGESIVKGGQEGKGGILEVVKFVDELTKKFQCLQIFSLIVFVYCRNNKIDKV